MEETSGKIGKLGYVYFLDDTQPSKDFADPYNLYVGKDSSIFIKQVSSPNFFTKKVCFKKFINVCNLTNSESYLIFNEAINESNIGNSGEVSIKIDPSDTTQSTIKIYSILKDSYWKITFIRGVLKYQNSININVNICINSESKYNMYFENNDNKILANNLSEFYFKADKEKDCFLQFKILSDKEGVMGDESSPNIIIFEQLI